MQVASASRAALPEKAVGRPSCRLGQICSATDVEDDGANENLEHRSGGGAGMRSHDRWSRSPLLIAVMAVAAGGCGDASRGAAPPSPPVVQVEPVVGRDVAVSAEW